MLAAPVIHCDGHPVIIGSRRLGCMALQGLPSALESGSRLSTKACGGGGAETSLQPGRGDSQVEAGSGKILHPQSSTKEGSMHVSAGDCSLALGQVAGQC